MNSGVLSFAALALCFAGMAALSLAMERHHEQFTGHSGAPSPRRRWLLRTAGMALLALAVRPCVQASGVGVGLTAWCGWLTVAALAVAWTLPYRPRGTAAAAACAGLAALLALAM